MSVILRMLGRTQPEPVAESQPEPVAESQPEPHADNPWTNPAWWGGGVSSVAGVTVSPETALKISTVYACVGLISETIASLPLVIYRWIEDMEGRERARNHPLYPILHDQPNEMQTAFEFVQMMQAHALLRGSGYAQIQPGPRGFVDQLIPLHPDQVQKQRLGQNKWRYQVTDVYGKSAPVNAEDIFEVGGMTLNGMDTLSVVSYARDGFGLALAAEGYGGRLFRNDSRPGGVLETDKKLSADAARRLKAGWEAAHSGSGQHRVAVLEEGLRWHQVGISPNEAQFLETREFQAEDICRWFRVPPHMVGLTSKTTSWGSGIEEMTIGYLTYTLRPWLTRWTQAIRRDLILAPDTYFADFVVDALLRGDIEGRYNAYSIGRQWGWLSVNDIRRFENMNPVDGGNTYLQPMNMVDAAEEATAVELTPAPVAKTYHHRLLAEEAAGRLVRKERAAVTRIYERGVDVATAVDDFYTDHIDLVAQNMRVSAIVAGWYCQQQLTAVTAAGGWPDTDEQMVNSLANMALESAAQ